MESWCFDSLDRGYVSSETIPPSDSIIRTKNVLMGLEFKSSFGYDGTNQQSMQNPGFPQAGFVENVRKQHLNDSVRNLVNTSATSNVIPGDDELSSIVESNCRASSLVDLKLGGFRDKPTFKPSTLLVWSEECPTPRKRARLTSLSSQAAYCQVYGCNKDLSSAKEYHKRHRVCDVHSKTAKVIVNGIQQRFCQQCSRFHLLAEFDDGKRSCRKRLAGHNERRRKPQVGFRAGQSLYSHTDILPRGPPHADIYETNMWDRHIKVEDGLNYVHRLDNTCPSELVHQYRPLVGNINTFGIGSAFSENMSQYPSEVVSHSLNEDSKLFGFDVASTVEGCALSLLSSQSQKYSGCSSIIRPSGGRPHYSVSEISEKLFGVQDRCSEFTNNKDHFSCEDGNAITLLQLSSQLQRVENQRQSAPIRQETEGSWCL